MVRRTEVEHSTNRSLADKGNIDSYKDHSDFYERWYAKFGQPQTMTLPADEFLARMKEMIEFE